MEKVFSAEFQVRDYELDQYGVVNNAVYLNYLEHARHQFLNEIGIAPAAVAQSGSALALSEINVRYQSPLRSRESFRVEVRVREIRGARVVFSQRIVASGADRPVLEARAVAVFLDPAGRPLRMRPEHRAAFSAYLDSKQTPPPSRPSI